MYDDDLLSIPLEEGILTGFDLCSIGRVIIVGAEIGGIAGVFECGSEGGGDLLAEEVGEVDAVEVAVVLDVRHSFIGRDVPFFRLP
jgi:hypothetical protein